MPGPSDNFYLSNPEPVKGCLLALRGIILSTDSNLTETVKYGMPCFCYKNKPFCYLWTDKKTGQPYILMVPGRHLDHPLLEAGSRASMKILRVNAEEDIPMDVVTAILGEALELYRNGTIKVK